MPSTPTGGLSIFVNLAIVLVSALFQWFKKLGISSNFIIFCGKLLSAKQYDSFVRRFSAYSIVFIIGITLPAATTISIIERIKTSTSLKAAVEMIALLSGDNQ